MFLIYITPEIQSAVSVATDNETGTITNTFVVAMLNMGAWLLPVGGIIGIFYGIFRLFTSGRSRD